MIVTIFAGETGAGAGAGAQLKRGETQEAAAGSYVPLLVVQLLFVLLVCNFK